MSASEQHGSHDHSDRRRGGRDEWGTRGDRGFRGRGGGQRGGDRSRQDRGRDERGGAQRGGGYRSRDDRPSGERSGWDGDRRAPRPSGRRDDRPRSDRRDGDRGGSGYRSAGRGAEGSGRSDNRGRQDRGSRDGGFSRGGGRDGHRERYGRDGDRRGGPRDGKPAHRREDDRAQHRRDGGGRDDARPRFIAPEIDDDVTGREIDRSMRHELKALEPSNAERVSQHLVMVARYIDDDPAFALEHANAAVRKAGRIGVVREAAGVAAYAAGDYALALKELRTHRRISGSQQHLPLMVDSQRALGRTDKAMEEATSSAASELDGEGSAELAMVVSGMHADAGDHAAALAALEIPQLDRNRGFAYSPKLFRAYADALRAVGRDDESFSWERQAVVAEAALGMGQFSEPEIVDLGDDLDEDEARRTVRRAQEKHSAPPPETGAREASGPAERPSQGASPDSSPSAAAAGGSPDQPETGGGGQEGEAAQDDREAPMERHAD